jgi:hypothetical protein
MHFRDARSGGAAHVWLLTPYLPRRKTKLLGSPFFAGSWLTGWWVRFFLCAQIGQVMGRSAGVHGWVIT